MHNRFLEYAANLIREIDDKQQENIESAAALIARCLIDGGVIQAFGSGHSYAAAIEIVERAGGLFASKLIKDPAMGIYEAVEGIGDIIMKKVEVKPEDVFIITSYSGRNPVNIEIAKSAKEQGAKIIVVTSLNSSKQLVSRHKSGKLLYEFADVILDMMGMEGDAAMEVEGLPERICPASSVAAASLIQATLLRAVEKMMEQGVVPDIRVSRNLDGGTEHNLALQDKYAHRIFRI